MRRSLIASAGVAVLLLAAGPSRAVPCAPPACTKIIDNGPDAVRKVIVVMGDGYTATEQMVYSKQVEGMLVEGMFGNDFFAEQQNAFNVYRLNLISTDWGLSEDTYDQNGTPDDPSDDTLINSVTRDSALKYIFTGVWGRCWLEHTNSGSTDLTEEAKLAALADNDLSYADYIVVILNHPGYGGCNRGPRDIVQTQGVVWQVLAHEAGHGIGDLEDEYGNVAEPWTGGPETTRNCSTVLDRGNVLWNRYIDGATAVPTVFGAGMDSNRTVGMFEGCGTKQTGIWRPVDNCRMRGNFPDFCPVCQNLMRNSLYPFLQHKFDRGLAGDFDGDGRDDVLVQSADDLAIYRAGNTPNRLDRVWTANNRVPAAPGFPEPWILSSGDQLFVADFDGDDKDDVYVLNTTSWPARWVGLLRSNGTGLETLSKYSGKLPDYGFIGAADQLFPADFDGDGNQDLYLFSGASWGDRYMGLLRSTGTALTAVARHDASIADWTMGAGDRYHVADFDGDSKDDLYVFNGSDWGGTRYLGMLKSSGAGLAGIRRYTDTLASGWYMGVKDHFYVGDIDGDGKDDLYVFNGTDWSSIYLEMTKSTGTALDFVKRYDDDAATAAATDIPGWTMKEGDRFFVADANKDGRADLFVFNPIDWGTEHLGTLESSGTDLSGSWVADWVTGIPGAGAWNLGILDNILPANYQGGPGKPDLYILNTDWLGLIRRSPAGFVMDRHYYQWIHSPIFDSKPWSPDMP